MRACFHLPAAGSLFADYIGSEAWIIVLMLGVLSLSYTAVGGLVISIVTDQIQGIASVLLFSICIVYVAATFRYPLPQPPPCDEDPFCISGCNEVSSVATLPLMPLVPQTPHTSCSPCPGLASMLQTGLGSIFAMPISLACGVLFSEAPFQRVWASRSPRVVWTAAAMSSAAIIVGVTFAGLCGLLAAWAELIPDWVSPNLYFFYALKGSINEQGMVANWIGVVSRVSPAVRARGGVQQSARCPPVRMLDPAGLPRDLAQVCIVLMVTMSESTVDSIQASIW